MRPFISRLTLLSTLVVLGLLAIAQAQRASTGNTPTSTNDPRPTRLPPRNAASTSNPPAAASPPASDPFAARNAPPANTPQADDIPPARNVFNQPLPPAAAAPRFATQPAQYLAPVEAAPADNRYDALNAPASNPLAPSAAGPAQFSASSTAQPLAPPAAVVADLGVPSGTAGTGRPGAKQLEGPQTPSLVVEKIAPPEVQVGKPVMFNVQVRNVGGALAQEIVLRDEVPQGAQLLSTKPRADRGPRGELVWQLGTLKPGDEIGVQMELLPTAEGELGSVATVQFATLASSRSLATRPELALDVNAPRLQLTFILQVLELAP